jgi:circadian clock protein KaiB
MTGDDATLHRFEEALVRREETHFELTLIVSGASDLSARAIANATSLCERHMNGRYHLSVVDLHEAPASVLTGHVLAAPTLVKTQPLPMQKFVGDLSHSDKVLVALGLPTETVRSSGDPSPPAVS